MSQFLSVTQTIDTWFASHQRVLPWRIHRSAYRVWISELMLQQTQVSRVVLFFEHWMEKFPSLADVAHASEAEVFKAWEGLGYYSRARAIIKTAHIIMDKYSGVFPNTVNELLTLPGIGPYTAGAICSFAFHKRTCAIDTNVRRFVCRLLRQDDVQDEDVEKLLSRKQPWHTMEALIEFGALVCTKRPSCGSCPLASMCPSAGNIVDVKKKKIVRQKLRRYVAVFVCKGKYLVCLQQEGLMKGLYQFPFALAQEGCLHTDIDLQRDFSYTGSILSMKPMSMTSHSFTTVHCTLLPWYIEVPTPFTIPGGTWLIYDELNKLAFSSGHKKILHELGNVLNRIETLSN